METISEINISEKIKECVSFLSLLADHPQMWVDLSDEERIELMKAAGRISRPQSEDRRQRKYVRSKSRRQAIVKHERKVRAATGIRSARDAVVFQAPAQLRGVDTGALIKDFELKSPRNCYVCSAEYTKLHFFYDAIFIGFCYILF